MAFLAPLQRQFSLYLVSGTAAFVCDFGSYFLMLHFGVWYVAANIASNIVGFFCTFFFHKYFVFGKRDDVLEHFVRYCILTGLNVLAQTALLLLFVEQFHMDAGTAKFASWALTVVWNFFLYKFFVYV